MVMTLKDYNNRGDEVFLKIIVGHRQNTDNKHTDNKHFILFAVFHPFKGKFCHLSYKQSVIKMLSILTSLKFYSLGK